MEAVCQMQEGELLLRGASKASVEERPQALMRLTAALASAEAPVDRIWRAGWQSIIANDEIRWHNYLDATRGYVNYKIVG